MIKGANFGHKFTCLTGDKMTHLISKQKSIFKSLFGSEFEADGIDRVFTHAVPCTLATDPLNNPNWKRWSC